MNLFFNILSIKPGSVKRSNKGSLACSFTRWLSLNLGIAFVFIPFLTIGSLTAQTFVGSFDLVATQQYPNGNVRNDTIGYYFGSEKTAIRMFGRGNDSDMRMVFSPSDSTITTLFEINGKKGGFILPMDEAHWPGMPQAFRAYGIGPRTALNYTGEAQKIEGFTCREVVAENEDYTARLWLAEDIQLSMTHVLSYQSVGKGKSKREIELFEQFGVEGLPLILFLESKTDKADVTIRLINFSETLEELIFSTEGHSLTKVD